MNMTTVPSNQLKAMQQEIADLKEQLAQLRIEASKAADLIEAQAAEIGVLKIAHEAHQTNNLKMLAVLKKQNAEIEKYKALCDQMATVMTNAVEHRWPYLDDMRSLIEAGGAMR